MAPRAPLAWRRGEPAHDQTKKDTTRPDETRQERLSFSTWRLGGVLASWRQDETSAHHEVVERGKTGSGHAPCQVGWVLRAEKSRLPPNPPSINMSFNCTRRLDGARPDHIQPTYKCERSQLPYPSHSSSSRPVVGRAKGRPQGGGARGADGGVRDASVDRDHHLHLKMHRKNPWTSRAPRRINLRRNHASESASPTKLAPRGVHRR